MKGTVDVIYGQFDQYEQPFRTKDDRYLYYFQSICSIDCFSDSIYGIFLIQQCSSS